MILEFLGLDLGVGGQQATTQVVSSGGSYASWFWLVFVIILMVFLSFVIGFIIYYRRYKYRIIYFANFGEGYREVGRDRARKIRVSPIGTELLWLRKKKKYVTSTGRMYRRNTYAYAIGQDGLLYNCLIGDLDAKKGMLDIVVINPDVRHMEEAINMDAEHEYNKQNFFEKYGVQIMLMVTMVIFLVGVYVIIAKYTKSLDQWRQIMETVKITSENFREASAYFNEVVKGGSGLVKA